MIKTIFGDAYWVEFWDGAARLQVAPGNHVMYLSVVMGEDTYTLLARDKRHRMRLRLVAETRDAAKAEALEIGVKIGVIDPLAWLET